MNEFRVYVGDELVGFSKLENGDPPMGIVFGSILVTPRYAQIADQVRIASARAFDEVAAQAPQLTNGTATGMPPVKVQSPDGAFLDAATILILDYSIEPGRYLPEVQVIGVPNEVYCRLFAHHWRAYDERFGGAKP